MLPAFITGWTVLFIPSITLEITIRFFVLSFFIFTISVLIKNVFFREKISRDLIFGAICIYILIGIAWAQIYALIEIFIPTSFPHNFNLLGPRDATSQSEYFIYFSFVTLTTLGYGDINPISSPARFFSILEALTGQLYIATAITRTVSLYLTRKILMKIKK